MRGGVREGELGSHIAHLLNQVEEVSKESRGFWGVSCFSSGRTGREMVSEVLEFVAR